MYVCVYVCMYVCVCVCVCVCPSLSLVKALLPHKHSIHRSDTIGLTKLTNEKPSAIALDALAGALGNAGRLKEMDALLADYNHHGVPVSIQTITKLIYHHGWHRDIDGVCVCVCVCLSVCLSLSLSLSLSLCMSVAESFFRHPLPLSRPQVPW
jgi:hypothetical protein